MFFPVLFFDLRVAVRRLLARRGSTVLAIVTLSIGIGAVSTMYALFSAATNDLPRVPGADRIARVYVENRAASEGRIPPSIAEWKAWVDASPRGITLAVVDQVDVAVDASPKPGEVLSLATGGVQRVTRSFFDVAGVQPEEGRRFDAGEPVAVISRRLWDLLPSEQRRLGTMLLIGGDVHAIVGVMPAGFWLVDRHADVWLPYDERTHAASRTVVARLENLSETQAAASLTPAVRQFRGPAYSAGVRFLSTDAAVRRRFGMLMMIGPALLVLISVCANISALLIGALHARRRELAVRAAIGASRWRLAREVLCDAIVIAAVGGVASLAGTYWSIRALRAALAGVSPEYAAMIPSVTSVAPVAFATTALAVLGVGYAPALIASRTRIVEALAGIEPIVFRRGRYGLADLLLALQIAMAAGLVLWTAVFASVFKTVMAVEPHVPVHRLWTMTVTATGDSRTLPPDSVKLILDRTGAMPGVEAAGLVEDGGARRTWIARSSAGAEMTCTASIDRVAGAYFATHRFPTTGALRDSNEAILNEAALKRCGNPVSVREIAAGAATFHVSGSVSDAVVAGEAIRGAPSIYEQLIAPHGKKLLLHVLMRAPRAAETMQVRNDLGRAVPGIAVGQPQLVGAALEQEFSAAVLIGRLMAVLAALALLLGIIGLHAAIAQALTARTCEIGIRIALGASPRNVVASTIGHHAAPAIIGIVLGMTISVAGLLLLSTDDASMIRELALVAATSLRWWTALIGLLIIASLVSATMPVLRALRLSPADVLRRE